MLRNDERWVIHMEAGIGWTPENAPPQLSMGGAIDRLASLAGTADGRVLLDRDPRANRLVTLDEVQLYPRSRPQFACLLLTYSDPRGADPGFQHQESGAKRIASKRQGEGNAASAHLVVALEKQTAKKHEFYAALLEDVTGIGKTKIAPALTRLLRSTGSFLFLDENESKRSARPLFLLNAREDEKVEKDASQATLSHFVAIRERKLQPYFDEAGQSRVTKEEVRIRPTNLDDTSLSVPDRLRAVIAAASKKKFDRVRVVYRRPDGKGRQVTYGTHREDAEDFLIKRIEKYELETPIEQTAAGISDELMRRMIASLKKQMK